MWRYHQDRLGFRILGLLSRRKSFSPLELKRSYHSLQTLRVLGVSGFRWSKGWGLPLSLAKRVGLGSCRGYSSEGPNRRSRFYSKGFIHDVVEGQYVNSEEGGEEETQASQRKRYRDLWISRILNMGIIVMIGYMNYRVCYTRDAFPDMRISVSEEEFREEKSPAELFLIYTKKMSPMSPDLVHFGHRVSQKFFHLDEIEFWRHPGQCNIPAGSYGSKATSGFVTPVITISSFMNPRTQFEAMEAQKRIELRSRIRNTPRLNAHELDQYCRVFLAHEIAHIGLNHRDRIVNGVTGMYGAGHIAVWLANEYLYQQRGFGIRPIFQFFLLLPVLLSTLVWSRIKAWNFELEADIFSAQVMGAERAKETLSYYYEKVRRLDHSELGWFDRFQDLLTHAHPPVVTRIRNVAENAYTRPY